MSVGAFPQLDLNIQRFEKTLERLNINGSARRFTGNEFLGYQDKAVDNLYQSFLAGISYANFEAATGLKAVPNAGFKL